MKRTQEKWNNPHPYWEERKGISGLKEFDGEDLKYDSKNKYFQQEQKKWLDQQRNEKQNCKNREKYEEHLYAQQILEVTRMRGMLEDDFAQKKTDMKVAHKDNNLDLAREKRNKEEEERKQKLLHEQNETRILLERGVKQAYN